VEGNQDWDVPKDHDPFFEAPDAEVLIGVVHVYLQSLAYMVEVDEQLPITDFKGNERGQLKIVLVPCGEDGHEIVGEFVDSPEDLIGKNLSFKVKIPNGIGLPRKFVSSRCKYRFFVDERDATTLDVTGTNPGYGHEKMFTFKPITKQLVDYLKDSALVVEVLGKQSDKEVSGGIRRNVSVPVIAPGGGEAYRNKADKLQTKMDKIQQLLNEALNSENKSLSVKTLQSALEEERNRANGHVPDGSESKQKRSGSKKKRDHSKSDESKKKTVKQQKNEAAAAAGQKRNKFFHFSFFLKLFPFRRLAFV